MRPIASTDTPTLSYGKDVPSHKIRLTNTKVGWLHSFSDKKGAKFDIQIRDAFGGLVFERKNFGTDTDRAGELVNLAVRPGEELDIEVKNIRGADKVDIFLN